MERMALSPKSSARGHLRDAHWPASLTLNYLAYYVTAIEVYKSFTSKRTLLA